MKSHVDRPVTRQSGARRGHSRQRHSEALGDAPLRPDQTHPVQVHLLRQDSWPEDSGRCSRL